MANPIHTPVENDPQELERAQVMWANFTEASKWGIAAIIALLFVLYLAFV